MSGSQKATVVVIDDNPFVCRALKTELEILGFNVSVFHGAESFLASQFPIDDTCLLSDIYMPGMNGIELCRHLASAGRSLGIVLMSGRDDEQTRRLARQAKPAAILFKPFDEVALLRAIRKALGHRSKSKSSRQ